MNSLCSRRSRANTAGTVKNKKRYSSKHSSGVSIKPTSHSRDGVRISYCIILPVVSPVISPYSGREDAALLLKNTQRCRPSFSLGFTQGRAISSLTVQLVSRAELETLQLVGGEVFRNLTDSAAL